MRAFADTNIVVYAESDDGEKSRRARTIIEGSPVISTQVVIETIAALTGKYGFSRPDAYEVASGLCLGRRPSSRSEVLPPNPHRQSRRGAAAYPRRHGEHSELQFKLVPSRWRSRIMEAT